MYVVYVSTSRFRSFRSFGLLKRFVGEDTASSFTGTNHFASGARDYCIRATNPRLCQVDIIHWKRKHAFHIRTRRTQGSGDKEECVFLSVQRMTARNLIGRNIERYLWRNSARISAVAPSHGSPSSRSTSQIRKQSSFRQRRFDLHDAATGKRRKSIEFDNSAIIQGMLENASNSQQVWYNEHTPKERAVILQNASDILNKRAEEFMKEEVSDTGRTLSEIAFYDLPAAINVLSYYSNLPSILGNGPVSMMQNVDNTQNSISYILREPLGVTVGIGAWNYPLMNVIQKSVPALAFGNAMIYKPSELTPGTAQLLAEVYEEAGVPNGVFQVLLGDGQTIAEGKLMESDIVGKVSFTGSVDTGKEVHQAVSLTNPNFPKVTLELGGKSPLIIMDDCNVEKAVNAAMVANWTSNGQVCSNGTRVFVHASMKDKFLDLLVEQTKKLKIGHPMKDGTDIGPMISKSHMKKVMEYIDIGKNTDKATLIYGGKRPKGTKGYFLSPAIFSDCTDDMRIVQEEVFGMLMSVLTFEDEEEVITRANATPFGLAAGVYTDSLTRAHRIARQLKVGTVWINNYNLGPVELPWGGRKQSGTGSENGTYDAMFEWTTAKSVYVELDGN